MPLRRPPLLRRLFGLLRTAHDHVSDWRLNIDTRPVLCPLPHGVSRFDDGIPSEPLHHFLIKRFIGPLSLGPDDVVIDIGCGTGRVACVLARRRVKSVVGIEVARTASLAAQENAARLRGRRSPVRILTQDAVEGDYDEGTVFWLYHPFGPETMRAVLDRLAESVRNRPRRIRLAYIHPLHEDIVTSSEWLRCYARRSSRLSRLEASFWTNANGTEA